MANETILIAEDEPEILELLQKYLGNAGYQTVCARDGRSAKTLAQGKIDLILLDIGLPELDGLEVTRLVRQSRLTPILILTARAEETDRILGLELGADDYMTKPFSPRELVARVKALLRRAKMPSLDSTQNAGLVLDSDARTVAVDGKLLELTPTEYQLLALLIQSPSKTFSRDELLDRVWGPEYVADSRRVDMHMSKLREKLHKAGQASLIRSVWGVGYRFE